MGLIFLKNYGIIFIEIDTIKGCIKWHTELNVIIAESHLIEINS